jgi:hypothetical protein
MYMMNWKECGKKRLWPNFMVLSRNFPGGAEKNHEKPQSVYPISWSIFEAGTSLLRSRCVNHSTIAFVSSKD